MSVPLTYMGFHLVFIIPPLLVLGWLAARRETASWGRAPLSGLAIMLFLAVVYTTPWTNVMIPRGVWWYGDGAVLGTIWYTPIEEYLFFILQPILTAFWLFQFLTVEDRSLLIPLSHRLAGAAGGLSICILGYFLMATTSTFYLGSLLFWAGPILAIQWAFGITYLIKEVPRLVAVALAVPTLYLWIADRIAIELGIWSISETHTIGLSILGLPIEEALFFLLTNVFLVQGIVLYMWLLDRPYELAGVGWISERAQALDRERV
ncbi:lycopene cyclase domain-containing protein [Natranaeroarchaeum aerophilus]|uniref:Lycopene cyclase domain-containing protein n=1 Tax=Natranaeroarchaeum aerophilus TaxID=2917711 RepID=A0AAE3FTB7_9EURY|nr:lycopene cyclase domain-containing protein [Natranaeroarchaeum aerophilus]MCL9814776.1 lycopene cyclase domain-containing protein [Natranaeroarchaeum aerophilus]